MLERFWVTNFKSLVKVEFRPAGVNLLVGANNAGKTNLCHALRFLGLSARMPLDDAAKQCIAEPWNLPKVYSGEDVIELAAECSLQSDDENLFSYHSNWPANATPGRSLRNSRSACVQKLCA